VTLVTFLKKRLTDKFPYNILIFLSSGDKINRKYPESEMNEPNQIEETEKINRVARLLKGSQSILFITGAGISADSGLPTYRGIGGLYENRLLEDGMAIETILSGTTLLNRPELTWKYISQIEKKCRGVHFNRGHEIIAEMETCFKRVWTLTQNVDGLHRAAGSRNLINIHGDIHELICTECDWNRQVKNFAGLSIPPVCPECEAPVRPDVVFFGEMLPDQGLTALSSQLEMGFDVTFSIGTSSVFPYIMQPVIMARHRGRPTIEINPDRTEISELVDIKINLSAATALDAIWKRYQENKQDRQ
jgi:NAD-dependent deacetylase